MLDCSKKIAGTKVMHPEEHILISARAICKRTISIIFIVLLGVACVSCSKAPLQAPIYPNADNSPSPTLERRACEGMSIAAYFPPGTWWNWMAASYPATRSIIANNDAGPGSTQETTLLSGIHQMKQAGIRVFGYVFTSSGTRNPAEVRADIDRWRAFYNVTDIMFDEGLAMMKNFSYYRDLANYIHTQTPGSLVELNTGAPVLYGESVNEAYMQVADILSLYEGSYANYLNFRPPAWTAKYPAARFKNYIYGVPDAEAIPGLLQHVLQNHIGYFDITDTDPSHIWGELASDSFWKTLVPYVKAVCR